MTDCICLIPARGGSRGIPAKNLHSLAGSPLVSWAIRQGLAADIGPVIVVTDSPEIAKITDSLGLTVYDEPAEIAGDNASLESVMSWFLGQCRERSGELPDWLMVLQPTSPLRLSGMIREAWAVCKSGAFDSVFSVVPSAHCSWRYQGGQLVIEWPQDPEGKGRRRMLRQQAGRQVTENGAIYAARAERFLVEETRFCGRTYAYEMPLWTSHEIDGPEELAIVELIMRARMQLGSEGIRT